MQGMEFSFHPSLYDYRYGIVWSSRNSYTADKSDPHPFWLGHDNAGFLYEAGYHLQSKHCTLRLYHCADHGRASLSRIDTANAEKIWKCLRYSCDKSAVCIAAWKSSAECPCFALSMMICYVVLKSGSILPGIAIHFLNNAFAIMEVSLLSDNGQISTVFLILEALFLLYAMFTLYQKRLIIRNYIIHNRGSRVRTFFSNWISILFLVLCVFIMITSFQRT